MRNSKVSFGAIQGALLLGSVLIGLLWYSRSKLPCNEEGRWFDEEQMIVYEYHTVEVLRVSFMVSFTTWVVSLVGTTKHDGCGR